MRIVPLATCLLAAACTDTGLHADISYDDRFGDATTMDIHVPSGPASGRPTIMLIHGGAWRGGDKEMYESAAERYAAAGYVAATINYRLFPTATYPAAVQDSLCALSFLRAHAEQYGIDPARIAVSGYSAGGQLSALVGVGSQNPAHQPDCEWGPTAPPAAAIPADGVYDFTTNDNFGWVADFLGGSKDAVPDNYRNASPVFQVTSDAPPFLLVHGHNDPVPIEGAEELAHLLREAGVRTRMLDLGGSSHLTSPVTASDGLYLQAASDTPEAWAVTLDFLSTTLGAP
jgi:acetyl esterase/lipase